ncbi:MAG: hypothetical protein ACOY0T_12165 [Myxococcota bacterium]
MSVDELFRSAFDVEAVIAEAEARREDVGAWWTAASVLSSHGRYAEAALAWERAAELSNAKERGPAFYNSGNEHLRAGNARAALKRYVRAAEVGFDEVEALMINAANAVATRRAAATAEGEDRREAEALIAAHVHTACQWADFGNYLERRVGDRRRAAEAFERAIELEPAANMGEWWLQLAEQRVALGDVDGAQIAYQKGLELGHSGWEPLEREIGLAQQGKAEQPR